MRDFVLFQLYGSMAAWGDMAVGEYRPSFAHPSKSAITGLLAAALGIRRQEEEKLIALEEGFLFAVRVDSMGVLLRDYHTIQMPGTKRGVIHRTRKSELTGDNLNTLLSSRDYYCDAAYSVAVSANENAIFPAQEIFSALKNPVFTLYLGRKSCPLALPLCPRIIQAIKVDEAFAQFQHLGLEHLPVKKPSLIYWEDGLECDTVASQRIVRRDAIRSRQRWQFSPRNENCGFLDTEGSPCTSA